MNPVITVIARLVAVASVLLVAGCAERLQPIYNVEKLRLPEAARWLSMRQIETRIILAARRVNWRVRRLEAAIRIVLGLRDKKNEEQI